MSPYRVMVVAMLVCVSLFLAGYSAPRKKVKLPATYKIRNIHAGVVAQEQDQQLVQDLCANFRMNEAEVREFFAKADEISAHVREHGYDWLPCYVRGDLVLDKKTATWEIQASATGWIKYPDGKIVHLGCKEACADLFKNK